MASRSVSGVIWIKIITFEILLCWLKNSLRPGYRNLFFFNELIEVLSLQKASLTEIVAQWCLCEPVYLSNDLSTWMEEEEVSR